MQIRYKALDGDGNLVDTVAEFKNRYEALAKLKESGLTVVEFSEEEAGARPAEAATWQFRLFGVSRDAVAFFTRQFSELIQAGMPLVQTLRSLQRFSTNRYLCGAAEGVIVHIRQGHRLSEGLALYPLAFDKLYINMVKVGESTGNLGPMLVRLADHLEADMAARSKVRAALVYPVFILLFSILLVYALVAFLLPSFEPMWKNAGLNLNDYPLTLFLMKLSAITHDVWDEFLVGTLMVASFFGLRHMLHTEQGGRWADRLLIRLPLVGHFFLLTSITRVTSALSIALDSGASFLEALQLSAGVAGNRVLAEALLQVANEVTRGSKLGLAFEMYSGVFPPLLIQMISLGEESGQVNSLLERLSRYYQNQLDAALKSFRR